MSWPVDVVLSSQWAQKQPGDIVNSELLPEMFPQGLYESAATRI